MSNEARPRAIKRFERGLLLCRSQDQPETLTQVARLKFKLNLVPQTVRSESRELVAETNFNYIIIDTLFVSMSQSC